MLKYASGMAQIAVLIPCYNEAQTIEQVIYTFREVMPEARIYVFDNNSSDGTKEIAMRAGAQISFVAYQGKGNVVRRMFADVEADVYVLVDGDGTYDASAAPSLVKKLIDEKLDMVVGARVSDEVGAYRAGHRLGNRMLTKCVAWIFGHAFKDMLSGYRVFSRRFAKSFPALSTGFEIETELAVHALKLRMPVAEIKTVYGTRPEGSASKLSTYRDGIKIGWMIAKLCKDEKPFMFFSLGFLLCLFVAIVLALPLLETYLQTGFVPRLPTAILCASLILLGNISLMCGIILDTFSRGQSEIKHLAYLTHKGIGCIEDDPDANKYAAEDV